MHHHLDEATLIATGVPGDKACMLLMRGSSVAAAALLTNPVEELSHVRRDCLAQLPAGVLADGVDQVGVRHVVTLHVQLRGG